MSLVNLNPKTTAENVMIQIAGETYHPFTDLLVRIPGIYAYLFQGKNFKSMKHFSDTLAVACCAEEAFFSGKRFAWLQDRREREMMGYLKMAT